MKTAPNTKFITWLDEMGTQTLVGKLKVDQSTISHWKRGTCWPRVEHIKKIRKMAKGRLTYEDIIDGRVGP